MRVRIISKLTVFFVVFVLKINSYQPPEYDLFVGGLFESPSISQPLNQPQKIQLLKEKKEDGTISNVFYIRNVSEFLYFTIQKNLPLIFYIYSEKNNFKNFYHELAQDFIGKVNFLSIDEAKNKDLFGLIRLFMKSNNIEIGDLSQYPIVLFCKPKALSIQNETLFFDPAALSLLENNGNFEFNKIKQSIIKLL
jgi:hypothetical protein